MKDSQFGFFCLRMPNIKWPNTVCQQQAPGSCLLGLKLTSESSVKFKAVYLAVYKSHSQRYDQVFLMKVIKKRKQTVFYILLPSFLSSLLQPHAFRFIKLADHIILPRVD